MWGQNFCVQILRGTLTVVHSCHASTFTCLNMVEKPDAAGVLTCMSGLKADAGSRHGDGVTPMQVARSAGLCVQPHRAQPAAAAATRRNLGQARRPMQARALMAVSSIVQVPGRTGRHRCPASWTLGACSSTPRRFPSAGVQLCCGPGTAGLCLSRRATSELCEWPAAAHVPASCRAHAACGH